MVKVKVRFIGTLRWAVKMEETHLEVPEPACVRNLISGVSKMISELGGSSGNGPPEEFWGGMLILINDVEAGLLDGFETILKDGDTVTLIPTAHGG
ncbi:MAG: MoaD/ThiS family protein [Candidatus Bathyarchaeia archaeon]